MRCFWPEKMDTNAYSTPTNTNKPNTEHSTYGPFYLYKMGSWFLKSRVLYFEKTQNTGGCISEKCEIHVSVFRNVAKYTGLYFVFLFVFNWNTGVCISKYRFLYFEIWWNTNFCISKFGEIRTLVFRNLVKYEPLYPSTGGCISPTPRTPCICQRGLLFRLFGVAAAFKNLFLKNA